MVAKSFEVGDLIWAKMKGYPFWPGKVMDPPAKAKSPKMKKSHYVFFFGSDNYAWISDENIVLHSDSMVEQYYRSNKKRYANLTHAVETIVNYSKSNSKYQKQSESTFLQLSTGKDTPKNKDSFVNSVAKKNTKKKLTVKKSIKRGCSSIHNGEESDEYKSPHKRCKNDEDYNHLWLNIPPNIRYSDVPDETIRPSSGILELSSVYKERPPTPTFDYFSRNEALERKEIRATTKTIGFLGLGKIGKGIVRNLMQSGHTVVIYDSADMNICETFSQNGASKVNTPSDVVAQSDITFCCVSDPEKAKKLVFENYGVLKGLDGCEKGKKGYVEMTSLDPSTSKAIADEVHYKGAWYLEAQFVGSITQAVEGSLKILCAGDESLYDECKSCFAAMGTMCKYVGADVGIASKFNIAQNMLLGTVYAAVAETLTLIERLGLEQEEFMKILEGGVLDSKLLIEKGYCMIGNNYSSNTTLKHMQKNINFALMLGSAVEQPMPITAAANEAYKHCKLLRYADHDVSAIYEGTKR